MSLLIVFSVMLIVLQIVFSSLPFVVSLSLVHQDILINAGQTIIYYLKEEVGENITKFDHAIQIFPYEDDEDIEQKNKLMNEYDAVDPNFKVLRDKSTNLFNSYMFRSTEKNNIFTSKINVFFN